MTLNSSISENAIQIMFGHLPILRDYARRTIMAEHTLSQIEEHDKAVRLEEFLNTGRSLNWTDKEIVTLLLREALAIY